VHTNSSEEEKIVCTAPPTFSFVELPVRAHPARFLRAIGDRKCNLSATRAL
jgi:hypothetical protein